LLSLFRAAILVLYSPTRRSSDLEHIGCIFTSQIEIIYAGQPHSKKDCVIIGLQRIQRDILAQYLIIFDLNATNFQHKIQFALSEDRKSTRLNSSHVKISYAVFCL